MKNIPRHKLDRWVLPGELKHRKKKVKSRRWKVKTEYVGPPVIGPLSWLHCRDRVLGHYKTEEEAKKAIKRAKNEKQWINYKFEVVKLKRFS